MFRNLTVQPCRLSADGFLSIESRVGLVPNRFGYSAHCGITALNLGQIQSSRAVAKIVQGAVSFRKTALVCFEPLYTYSEFAIKAR